VANTPTLHPIDIVHAAEHGDQTSRDLLQRSAHLVGEALAGIVNFFNPRVNRPRRARSPPIIWLRRLAGRIVDTTPLDEVVCALGDLQMTALAQFDAPNGGKHRSITT
jgi:predicted NBD/HSP70 family sugar kinase